MLSSFRIVPPLFMALFVALFASASLSACGDDSTSTPTDGSTGDGSTGDGSTGDGGGLGGPGDSCVTAANCEAGLDCVMGVCTATSNGEIGAPCIYTAQCMDGLYCSIPRSCQSEGTGVMFAACTDSGDCEAPLVCEPQATGSSRCVSAGGGDIGSPGDSCSTVAECQAGLFCIDGECRGEQGGGGTDGGVGDGGGIFDASVDTAVGVLCDRVTECDDGSECTIDQCVRDMCRNTLVDGDEDGYASTLIAGGCGRDCNDMNPSVNP
ncbi:MAG: hypothetical protein DRJ42_21410, partial [Deltaproteobacteria bacterium]